MGKLLDGYANALAFLSEQSLHQLVPFLLHHLQ
jgi:hypothetical protein